MKATIFGLVVASTLAAACTRTDPATPGNAPSSPVSGRASDAAAAPVATVRRADASRAAEVIPATVTTREITIPAGTTLNVALDTAIGSDTSRVEEAVTAHLTRAIQVHGLTVLPQGSRINGVVTDATRSAKVKGRAHVAVRFVSVTPRGDDQRYTIRTSSAGRTAAGTKQKDAMEIGAPAVRSSARCSAASRAPWSAPQSAAALVRRWCCRRAARKYISPRAPLSPSSSSNRLRYG